MEKNRISSLSMTRKEPLQGIWIWRKFVASFRRLGVFHRKNPVLGSVYHGIFHRSKECLRVLGLLRRIQVYFYSVLSRRRRSVGMPSTRRMPM